MIRPLNPHIIPHPLDGAFPFQVFMTLQSGAVIRADCRTEKEALDKASYYIKIFDALSSNSHRFFPYVYNPHNVASSKLITWYARHMEHEGVMRWRIKRNDNHALYFATYSEMWEFLTMTCISFTIILEGYQNENASKV